MAKSAVQLKVLDSGVALVTLDLPESKFNLLGSQMMTELKSVIAEVKGNPAVKGLIIASGKEDNFVAGADIKEIQAIQSQSPVNAYEASKLGKSVLAEIDSLPFNVVCAIGGICLGGGTELSLSCDFRLASGSDTKIGLPEVNLGFIPGWGGCVRLPKLIGLQAALDLILTGKTVDGKKAWKLGLVDEVVDPANLLKRAEEVALGGKVRRFTPSFAARVRSFALEGNPLGRKVINKMAYKGVMAQTRGKLPAPVEALKVVMKAASGPADRAFEAESQAFGRLAVSTVSRNLVGVFFAQQESKKSPSGAACDCEIKKIGVLGAGVMGSGIVQAAAYAGYQVVLYDIKAEAIEGGMEKIRALFDGLVEKRKLTREQAAKMVASIVTTSGYEAFADCDFVIEAIVEKMKIKKSVLAELEKVVKSDCFIFATNTSSLSVSTMAEDAHRPDRVVGVHFFNPVHKMPLAEIIRGKQTSDQAVACAKDFASRLGKTTVTAADSPGFVVNRILAPYLREAILLMEQGVPMADIDKAMRDFGMGFPGQMGPLELLDTVGLDICGEVIRVLHAALGERMAPPAILAKIESLKLLGKKGGKGIYLYDEKTGKRGEFNPDVVAAITAAPLKKSRNEIQDRLVLAMVNEAARCLEEGVISDPSQLDLAMIFGTGFPPYVGGPLRYADDLGLTVAHQKLDFLSKVAGDNYRPAGLLKGKAESGKSFYRS